MGAAYVDRLIELQMIKPSPEDTLTEGDLRRVRVVQMLEESGVTIDALGVAIARGAFSFDFVEAATLQQFGALGDETFADVSDRTGIPIELLMVVREACGGALPEPSDRMRIDELQVVLSVEAQLAHGYRARVVERGLRATGESLARIAETQAGAFGSEVIEPVLAEGKGWSGVSRRSEEVSPTLNEHDDRALLAIYHANQTRTWLRNILEGVETMLAALGLSSGTGQRVPAICFFDITGYTRMTEERGDEAAAEVVGRLTRTVQRTSGQHGGRPIKWLGDGVMLHFEEPARGVLAALTMLGAVTEEGLPPAHVGLHAGPVLFQEGDYFGRTVNVASRIAAYARPGEVLVTQEVVERSQGAPLRFDEIGPVELKGVTEALRLYAARPA